VIRLLVWVLPLLIIAVPAAAFGLFVVAVTGSPGACDTKGRTIAATSSEAVSFQAKWDQLNAELDAGRPATAIFTEGESTAYSRLWVEEHDIPVDDLLLCFNNEGASASGKVDVPFFPGDVDVLVEGTVVLTGETPEIDLTHYEVGGLPGGLADQVDTFINRLAEDELAEILLAHDYAMSFADGTMTVTAAP
jgi:hypothetical protein